MREIKKCRSYATSHHNHFKVMISPQEEQGTKRLSRHRPMQKEHSETQSIVALVDALYCRLNCVNVGTNVPAVGSRRRAHRSAGGQPIVPSREIDE